jgi:hypothetical protein
MREESNYTKKMWRMYNMKEKNIYGDKPKPFEMIFGDTPELRVIQELLPFMGRTNVANDETWLTFEDIFESTGVESPEFIKVLKTFKRFKMVLTRFDKKTKLHNEYALDKNSPVVRSIVDFDNALINVIIENEFPGNPT